MSFELMIKVRDAIADEANAFDMGRWGVGISDRAWWPIAPDPDAPWNDVVVADCGTAACIAGLAVRFGMPRRKSKAPYTMGWSSTPSKAAALLGLPSDERDDHWLFYKSEWPDWAQELSEELGQRGRTGRRRDLQGVHGSRMKNYYRPPRRGPTARHLRTMAVIMEWKAAQYRAAAALLDFGKTFESVVDALVGAEIEHKAHHIAAWDAYEARRGRETIGG